MAERFFDTSAIAKYFREEGSEDGGRAQKHLRGMSG
jgi:hypothetical protein